MNKIVSDERIQQRLSYFEDRCKQLGLRVTHQRKEIYRTVASSCEHPCAERVLQQVREKLPNVSLDTVYRTLASLEEMGLLRRVGLSVKEHFDGDLRPHGHFVCTQCGEIYDIFFKENESIELPACMNEVGQVRQTQVQFKGICKMCQSR